MPKSEERPKKAIQIARAWARGKATIEEVRNAADAAYTASAAAYTAYAAAYAAYAAADAAYAAYAAADAACSAACATSAASAACSASLKDSADIVRKLIKEPKPIKELSK